MPVLAKMRSWLTLFFPKKCIFLSSRGMQDFPVSLFTTWIVTKQRSTWAQSFQGTSLQVSSVKGSKQVFQILKKAFSEHFAAATFAQVSVDAPSKNLIYLIMQTSSFITIVLSFGKLDSWQLTLGDLAGLTSRMLMCIFYSSLLQSVTSLDV